MIRIAQHKVLVHGETFEHSLNHVNRYFDSTTLVVYDRIEPRHEQSLSALDASFFKELRAAEAKNRATLEGLLDNLRENGIVTMEDVGTMEQGYVSKIFHILSHFVDGFIGIDSYFYNLLDDSHWLPGNTAVSIEQSPESFWLIHLDCYAEIPGEAGLLHF
jgi:hypothetical protein